MIRASSIDHRGDPSHSRWLTAGHDPARSNRVIRSDRIAALLANSTVRSVSPILATCFATNRSRQPLRSEPRMHEPTAKSP
jgi:hypothetical protein